MTNSNLKDFGNFHANLAQLAYTGRPSNFPFDSQRDSDKDLLNSGQSLYFDFSQDNKFYNKDKKEWEITPGGKNLPHNGKIYLQPDPDLHTIEDRWISSFLILMEDIVKKNMYANAIKKGS